MEWGCCCTTAQARVIAECREGEDGVGKANSPVPGAELQSESLVQRRAPPRPHTEGSAGPCGRLGSIAEFSCCAGEGCSPLATGPGHCGVAALGSHSPPGPSHALRPRSLAPFPLGASALSICTAFPLFFLFNILFNEMFAVRLKGFVGVLLLVWVLLLLLLFVAFCCFI